MAKNKKTGKAKGTQALLFVKFETLEKLKALSKKKRHGYLGRTIDYIFEKEEIEKCLD